MSKLLDDIAKDPAARKARALAAQRNVATRFTYDAVAQALASAWMSAAAGKRK